MSNLELGRLFSMMEGVDPEGLFNAALLRAAGASDLGAAQASLAAALPPGLAGLAGLGQLEDAAGGQQGRSAASGGGGTTDDEDDRGSVGGTGANPPPRTGSINDRKCTKVLPASSSAPKYKFVVPNEYVYKFMKHLVERPFHMRDPGGKLWDCVLIQRKNKEKYEYMIQGWRRFGEATGVQEGDTVTIEMVSDTVLQLTLERSGTGGGKKRQRTSGLGGAYDGDGGLEGDASGNGLLVGSHASPQAAALPSLGMQQGGAAQQQQFGSLGGGGGGPEGLLALIQQQQAQQQQQQGGAPLGPGGGGERGTPQPVLTPRSLSHLANGLAGGNPLSALAAGGFNDAQLADLINQLEKRQRVGDHPGPAGAGAGTAPGSGAPPAAGGGGSGAIRLLSDVADLDSNLAQENALLREEVRVAQAKIATLETGVLNIKSVLTRNTDPGLVAMTGVINLLNQIESPDFLPELGTIGRMTLTGLCSEVRRHLNGVLRMVWILRSLPDDVQQHNGSAPGSNGGAA